MSDGRTAQLAAITVGAPTPLNGSVTLADYDPAWPRIYETLAAGVRETLGSRALDVFHVGSTSAPGLAAKPVIDMVLVVADSADESAYVADLEAADWRLRIREPDWFEHRLLRGEAPAAHLHVFSAACPEVARMIAFRDHLRADAADRALYEKTKRALAARTWAFTQDYADAKSEVVAQIMARAAGGSMAPYSAAKARDAPAV